MNFESLESRRLLSATLQVGAGYPYATIQAVADAAGPGDTVLIHAGDYGPGIVPHSGTANAPITFRAAGDGAVVIASGLDGAALTAHAKPSRATAARNNGDGTETVFGPGFAPGMEGRAIDGGWGQRWVFKQDVITASGYGFATFRFVAHTKYEQPAIGNLYYVTAPSGRDVPAAFDLSGRSFVNIVGLNLDAATITTDAGSHDCTLSGITARWVSVSTGKIDPWHPTRTPGGGGIVLAGSRLTLSDSLILGSGGAGVTVSGNDCRVERVNTNNTDTSGVDAGAIQVSGSRDTVSGCQITTTGRDGIKLSHSTAVTVTGNTIHAAMLDTTDGGGIYAYGTDGRGSVVRGNQIYDVRSGGFGAAGIYADNGCSNWTYSGNVVSGCTIGIKVNSGSLNIVAEGNTLAGNGVAYDGTGMSALSERANSVSGHALGTGPVVTSFGAWHKTHRKIGHGHSDFYWYTQPGWFAAMAA